MISVTNMALEGDDFFDNRYYVYNRRFLTIVGLWPYQEASKRLRYVCFVVVMIILGIICQIHVIIKSKFEVNVIADIMRNFLPTIIFSATYCSFVYKFSEMKEAFDRIKNDWSKLMNESELMMFQKYGEISRLCCLAIACVFYTYIVILVSPFVSCLFLYVCGIIDESQLMLPVKDESLKPNISSFLIIFSVELVAIITICTIGITYCTMLVAYALHSYALFAVTTLKLEEPFNKSTCKFFWTSYNTKRDDEYQWVVGIIKHHGDVINFVELLKAVFGASYVVQVFVAFLLIILDFFYFFQIIDSKVSMGEAIRNSVYIIGNLFMISTGFYMGQTLIDHSVKMYTTCCMIPFYDFSVKTNNLLLLLITRCTKPCEFSAGGIIVASHELFTKMAKASFSLATIFYNMR